MSGAFDPKSLFGFVCRFKQKSAMVCGDRPIICTVNYKYGRRNVFDLLYIFELVEREERISSNNAERGCKCALQNKPRHRFAGCQIHCNSSAERSPMENDPFWICSFFRQQIVVSCIDSLVRILFRRRAAAGSVSLVIVRQNVNTKVT